MPSQDVHMKNIKTIAAHMIRKRMQQTCYVAIYGGLVNVLPPSTIRRRGEHQDRNDIDELYVRRHTC